MVRVIVQQMAGARGAEAQVTKLGGTVTQDLHIINAFAAEMTAESALELARNESVRWVSLDVAVKESGGPDGTVNTANLINVYNRAIRADSLWAEGYQGSSVTVAILDSGINSNNDFKSRIKTKVKE